MFGVACLSVRNCARYLPKIFDNLNILSNCFTKFAEIFVYDNCSDNSKTKLEDFKSISKFDVEIYHNIDNNSELRTIRIAISRNKCIEIMDNKFKDVNFHIMIDADNINVKKWNINIIQKYLQMDTWDALSFNRNNYYDIWALLYDDYKHHCWGYGKYNNQTSIVVNHMKKGIEKRLKNLKNNELYSCLSAFNGFAIYRSCKFTGIRYNGSYTDFKHLITDEERISTLNILKKELNDNNLQLGEGFQNKTDECCEHLYYHLSAIKNNNARIKITKELIE